MDIDCLQSVLSGAVACLGLGMERLWSTRIGGLSYRSNAKQYGLRSDPSVDHSSVYKATRYGGWQTTTSNPNRNDHVGQNLRVKYSGQVPNFSRLFIIIIFAVFWTSSRSSVDVRSLIFRDK